MVHSCDRAGVNLGTTQTRDNEELGTACTKKSVFTDPLALALAVRRTGTIQKRVIRPHLLACPWFYVENHRDVAQKSADSYNNDARQKTMVHSCNRARANLGTTQTCDNEEFGITHAVREVYGPSSLVVRSAKAFCTNLFKKNL